MHIFVIVTYRSIDFDIGMLISHIWSKNDNYGIKYDYVPGQNLVGQATNHGVNQELLKFHFSSSWGPVAGIWQIS